ncbi:16S rRNA (cytosine(1402)-N(4))-methyltransferase RsmH [Sinirhodobacter sp. WL0062]|uniref:Ribosomal RNA small subunit methyltransferase H n=1 Tax=Rhodobacter flavimaris TaxID=2907145 RepID=A0ABS8YYN4_9RHOB|nr:16S rRNA (cytosine(1402)-N(4))-methyltransferase RsmH [Sinirhodobacter sp. WL0062]MCE5974618.1 16S rRNA (cytosine(1402)-N(4))-methyltransferase RsmH [Sinirhodobacter sp. WL0062]
MSDADRPHIPVLLRPLLKAVAPVSGLWLDGTFGAGGYTRGLLEAGAERVIGVDRDPSVFDMAESWRGQYGERLILVEGTFSALDEYAEEISEGQGLDGVVLDLGVSSMQLDQAERGFSFMQDGPLDMRMSAEGATAADLVNTASEEELADILYHYGEERASRRIARAIGEARKVKPFETTRELVAVIERCLPRPKPGQSHPATRSFQAIRIAVNDEFGQLIEGLEAAERALKPGGLLAVVTFHSLEDRVVKRFFLARSGRAAQGSRYAPIQAAESPAFELVTRKSVGPDDEELADNPRARSAKLRVARRTDAPAGQADRASLGLPAPVLRPQGSKGRSR